MFDEDTDAELRRSILQYHISGVMTDRERAKLLGLPEGCRIRENAKIISPGNLKCGEYVYIGEGVILDASGGLEIGDNTQFAAYALVYTHSSKEQALAGETGTSKDKIIRAPVRIGRNCWIGGPSIIYPGVTIGDRAVVLPMSVVNRDVDDGEVVGGAPIGKIDALEKRVAVLEEAVSTLSSMLDNVSPDPPESN